MDAKHNSELKHELQEIEKGLRELYAESLRDLKGIVVHEDAREIINVFVISLADRIEAHRIRLAEAYNLIEPEPSSEENQSLQALDLPDDCDFLAAAQEMQELIVIAETQAKEKGGTNVYEPDYLRILKAFLDEPNQSTAQALLSIAPTQEMTSLFTRHTPIGKLQYDNCAQSGSVFGLELWRLIVDDAKAFHQSHKDYIALNQSDFVQEELCIAIYITDQLLASWSEGNHEPFTSAALPVIAACFETEFPQTDGFLCFLRKSTDRLHEYRGYRFGGTETDNLAGSFSWESALKALGNPYPNPGTLLAYNYRKMAFPTTIGELLRSHLDQV